jgi:hypothetical protein
VFLFLRSACIWILSTARLTTDEIISSSSNGFGQVVVRSVPKRGYRGLERRVAGHDHDEGFRIEEPNLFEKLEAAHLTHDDVGEHERGVLLAKELERFFPEAAAVTSWPSPASTWEMTFLSVGSSSARSICIRGFPHSIWSPNAGAQARRFK